MFGKGFQFFLCKVDLRFEGLNSRDMVGRNGVGGKRCFPFP
jgi:hypothetical protein